MEWKNWSSHPVIVGVGIIIAVITLVNTLYKDHVKSGDVPSVVPSPSPSSTVSPSASPQSLPSSSSASSPSPKPSIQTPVKEIVSSASTPESPQSVFPTSTRVTPMLNPTKLASPEFSQKGSVAISFKNNSSNTLKCWLVSGNKNLSAFLMIEGQQSKHFDNFNSGSKIACSIDIDSYASTMLTHFSVAYSGDYELLLDRVPLSNIQGKNTWRYATVVVYPNGQSYYSSPK